MADGVKASFFRTTIIAWSGFNAHPSHAGAFFNKGIYDDYFGFITSNKQQIFMESQR